MDKRLLREFQDQVLLQCEYVLRAANELNSALAAPDFESAKAAFYAIQNLLGAAANISKAFWGQQGKNLAPQRKPLRDSVGMADTSPLKTVGMRNNFEHFDERLDTWWKDSKTHNLADLNIGPANMVPFGTKEILRQFDPATTEVVFWSQRFNLQSVIDEVNRIVPLLRAELAKR
jgi:hypothetical protein